MNSIKSLFNPIINFNAKALRVPHIVEQTLSIYPETLLACLDYLEDNVDNGPWGETEQPTHLRNKIH